MKPVGHVDPTRLCDAADAILDALVAHGDEAQVMMLLDANEQSEPDDGAYSCAELIEAMSLLMRLGVVEPRA
jgi:hypothetical protein